MQKFEKFAAYVRDNIKDYLPDEEIRKVHLESVIKNNGEKSTGLMMADAVRNVTPVIYLDGFYNAYLEGMPVTHILREIAELYQKNKPEHDFETKQIFDFKQAGRNVYFRLCNYEQNRERLADIPHKRIEDLAVTYHINVQNGFSDDVSSVLINKGILSGWGISLDELDAVAKGNMQENILPYFMNMGDMQMDLWVNDLVATFDFSHEEAERFVREKYISETNMWMVSNSMQMYGAGMILCPKIMDMMAEKAGETFYVIPSSMHEVIVVPYTGDREAYLDMEEVVRKMNEEQLSKEEILSDKMYMVDAKNHVFLRADRFEAYEKELEQKQQEYIQEGGMRFADLDEHAGMPEADSGKHLLLDDVREQQSLVLNEP